jgi:hypothetical protein
MCVMLKVLSFEHDTILLIAQVSLARIQILNAFSKIKGEPVSGSPRTTAFLSGSFGPFASLSLIIVSIVNGNPRRHCPPLSFKALRLASFSGRTPKTLQMLHFRASVAVFPPRCGG